MSDSFLNYILLWIGSYALKIKVLIDLAFQNPIWSISIILCTFSLNVVFNLLY